MHNVAPWCKSDGAFASFEHWYDVRMEEFVIAVQCRDNRHMITIPRSDIIDLGDGADVFMVSILNQYSTDDIEWYKVKKENE